jgi:hypothetical protein
MCDRACVVDKFHDLSHFNIQFPELGQSCLPANTEITGDCSNGNFDLGDGSCGGTQSQVAKCDNTSLQPGECLTMTLNIPGEETGPGLGVVVSKAGDACVESCMAGPSCEPCEDDDDGDSACLTRTRGFWGTHPHIAENFIPITVCGKELTTTVANVCGTSEALCTNAQDRKDNPPSLTLVAQLTAAKLNLEATEATVNGTCSDWEYDGKSIQEWIDYCEEDFCGASKKDIGKSGCIEALDAFNNSDDTGFEETPAPFDQPGPAQVGECQKARGNGISNYSCVQP